MTSTLVGVYQKQTSFTVNVHILEKGFQSFSSPLDCNSHQPYPVEADSFSPAVIGRSPRSALLLCRGVKNRGGERRGEKEGRSTLLSTPYLSRVKREIRKELPGKLSRAGKRIRPSAVGGAARGRCGRRRRGKGRPGLLSLVRRRAAPESRRCRSSARSFRSRFRWRATS